MDVLNRLAGICAAVVDDTVTVLESFRLGDLRNGGEDAGDQPAVIYI